MYRTVVMRETGDGGRNNKTENGDGLKRLRKKEGEKGNKYSKRKHMEERRWNEGVKGTDADQCMSSCSFWRLGSLLSASSRNTAGAALYFRTPVKQQQQHMAIQTRR